jgi:hypothetical protein
MQLQVLDASSSRVQQLQHLQELLGCMPELVELRLMHTPLAARCKVLEQVRQIEEADVCGLLRLAKHVCRHSMHVVFSM